MSDMTLEEFQRVGRQMIAEARERFRRDAMLVCRTDEERAKAVAFEPAIGEVSPEEAVLALKRWIAEGEAEKGPR